MSRSGRGSSASWAALATRSKPTLLLRRCPSLTGAATEGLHRPEPAFAEEHEDNIIGDEQRWHPEGRYPVGGPDVRRSVADGGQRDGGDQVEHPHDIEEPDEWSREL